MNILAIDTATEACSVALLVNNTCTEKFEVIPRQHTERVLPMVDTLLQDANLSLAQLDAIAFDCGPGSFTGVRVATSVAQGLAFSVNRPIIPVSSLAALAQLAFRIENKEHIFSSIDARMNEIYWGCYSLKNGIMQLVNDEKVSSVSSVSVEGTWHGIGSGCDKFYDELNEANDVHISSFSRSCFPHAQDVATLAESLYGNDKFTEAKNAAPSYIRDEVTWKKLKDQ